MKNITLTLLLFLNLTSFKSNAAIIFVNDDQDIGQLDGNCDLRDAINSANINISIDGCTAGQAGVQDVVIVQVDGPIQLSSTLPVFSSIYISTTISGDQVEVIAAPNQRVMRVMPNSVNDNDFSLINFKFSNGNAIDQITGGAIYFGRNNADHGVIEISGMTFDNNHAHAGGAIHFDNINAESVYIYNSEPYSKLS